MFVVGFTVRDYPKYGMMTLYVSPTTIRIATVQFHESTYKYVN